MSPLTEPLREAEDWIEQPSLVDLAADRIRELLLSGALQPGERLGEAWLSDRLGISRPPLREAIRILTHQGLLERLPRRGVRVVTLTARDVIDIYSLRAVLDRFALELAVPGLDPDRLTPMRDAMREMRDSVKRCDHAGYVNANRRFHMALIELARNDRLSITYELLMNQMQMLMSINLHRESLDDTEIGVRRHEELLAAIETGDLTLALAALAAHGERNFLPTNLDGDVPLRVDISDIPT